MSADTNQGSEPWHDRDRLEELYIEKGLTAQEVSDELGCSQTTVLRYLRKYDIEVEGGFTKASAPRMHHDHQGYEVFRVRADGASRTVFNHRLLAVAEHGFDAVVGNVVHHENGVPWDNRPENLEVMSRSEHAKHHHEQGDIEYAGNTKYTKEEALEWIEAFVTELGVVPSAVDIRGWPGPSAQVYRTHFGTFPEAVREAGYTPRGDRRE